MHKWTTIHIAFVECDAVTSGLKCSNISEEHGASIFRITSGGHIQHVCPKHRYSTRLRDTTFWKNGSWQVSETGSIPDSECKNWPRHQVLSRGSLVKTAGK